MFSTIEAKIKLLSLPRSAWLIILYLLGLTVFGGMSLLAHTLVAFLIALPR
jgi:hypothetical protein